MNKFQVDLIAAIQKYASKWLYGGSCVKTMRAVLEEIGLNPFPYELPDNNGKLKSNNVDLTIQWLNNNATFKGAIRIINTRQEAQRLANEADDYVILAMCANYKYIKEKKGGYHHVAFVIPGEINTDGSIDCGGGGMPKREWIFKPESFHFSWNYFGKPDFNCPADSNKNHMYYFYYAVK